MPISRREFESPSDPSAIVLEFLRAQADTAFTLEELLMALPQRLNLQADELRLILASLEGRRRVVHRDMEGVLYYLYRSERGFRPG